MYRYFNQTAVIKRQTTVDSKTSFVATGNSYNGYLKPISLDDGIIERAFGKQYNFTTYKTADIKEGDRVTINGEDFDVGGVAEWTGIIIKYKKILLTK